MTNYFMVGTIHGAWSGHQPREMLDEWIDAGEWVLGWHGLESDPSYQKQAPVLTHMAAGDVLVAKQMNNDFKTMLVKAIGIVTEPATDGHRVGVDWVCDFRASPVTLESSYRQTLTKVSDTPKSKALISDRILPLLASRAERVSGASEDVLAESSPADVAEVAALAAQVAAGDYSVADRRITAKTRGSAQRVFADQVKSNYGWRCALTGIATRDFLVASHIVPWSEDESIRLDPANGICLSTFVDRAFDTGYLLVQTDYTVQVEWARVGSDSSLRDALTPLDGLSLAVPETAPPNPEFLRRRLGSS